MKTIYYSLDHKLRIDITGHSNEVQKLLIEALTIPNVAKEEAKRMDQWGWRDMPDKIAMYTLGRSDDRLWINAPRGFYANFLKGAVALGLEPEFDWDGRKQDCNLRFKWNDDHVPHPWQVKMDAQIGLNSQGIIQAPAGSGKTVGILKSIQHCGKRACIVVHTKDIMYQWSDRIETFLPGTTVGCFGDGRGFYSDDQIVVAMAQSIHSQFDDLVTVGFFDDFGFVCLDECHHATAETFNKIMDRFSAYYRVGVSATPEKTGDFRLAELVLGPIICKINPAEVTTLTVPEIVKVPTRFGFSFRGQKNRWQRSNYPQMINALASDIDRAELVVTHIMANSGHHQLVISKRLGHLALMREMLEDAGFGDPILEIIGENASEDRRKAAEIASRMPCVIFSTLADEALDIPRLDRLHLTFPQKNTGLITQQLGRIERKAEGKVDAKCYDYCDGNVSVLDNQYKTRLVEVYKSRGLRVSRSNAPQMEIPF